MITVKTVKEMRAQDEDQPCPSPKAGHSLVEQWTLWEHPFHDKLLVEISGDHHHE